MRILVAEHRSEVRSLLLTQIRGWNLEAVGVEDGDQAWEVLAKQSPDRIDMLIADLAIPGVSGLSLVERVRQYASHANLPVLMICEIANKRDVVDAAQVGVSGFLTLPLEASTVRKKIFEAVRSHRKAHFDRQAKLIWENRIDEINAASGPLIVVGDRQELHHSHLAAVTAGQTRIDALNSHRILQGAQHCLLATFPCWHAFSLEPG